MGRTTALQDNYSSVEDAAASQRCSVICVIKVDRYGHVFLHKETLLMDLCGADAFAIATLEEAMLIMRALNAGFSSTMAKVAVNTRWGGGGHKGKGGLSRDSSTHRSHLPFPGLPMAIPPGGQLPRRGLQADEHGD